MKEYKTLAEIEKEYILEICRNIADNGNIEKVAKILKIGRTTLYRKLKSYGYKANNFKSWLQHIET